MFEPKNAAVILLFIVAVALGYSIFFGQEKTVDPQKFLAVLQNSSKLYIIQDLRGADDAVRRNIMQCGVDLAGSQGVAALNKTITIYALEDSKCTTLEGVKTLTECSNTGDGVTFYVSKGNQSSFYEKKLSIGIGADYTAKSCNINLR